eukprot:CAMPEP_0171180190 /NCGR_PEP_ID=MMETSP0790-20130122/13632_1 /TAXON_ID=2925 /ORGANISM="Alexandrium catenella, Strain OF101" /LENGTH=39 /DNA_ID= /DNA_START= /DNA_END= /DNA_ORIENTATION=
MTLPDKKRKLHAVHARGIAALDARANRHAPQPRCAAAVA